MSYKIMGRYKNRPVEEIDTAETHKEAQYLLGEYVMAFGSDWQIWIESE